MKALLILTLIVLIFGYPVLYYTTQETITISVTDKERITTGSGESIKSKYLVYTEGEVFENTDSWLFLKFSSADLQGSLKKNKSYKVKVTGWRIPFFSTYRNIISIKQNK